MDGDFAYNFDNASMAPITILETHEEIGCRVWDAATLLGKFFEIHSTELTKLLAHRSVVELGAGTGITAMVGARVLPPTTRILATDIPAVCRAMERTLSRNALEGRVACAPLVWGNTEHIAAAHAWARTRPVASEADRGGSDAATAASCPRASAVDFVIACDIAAPIKYADDFVATVAALLPPIPSARGHEHLDASTGPSSHAASVVATATVAAADGSACEGSGGCGESAAAGSPGSAGCEATALDSPPCETASGAVPEAADAAGIPEEMPSLSSLLRFPCALLACQMHRDITAPQLDGLRSVYGADAVREVPQSLLHPSFRSPRHTLYVVTAGR